MIHESKGFDRTEYADGMTVGKITYKRELSIKTDRKSVWIQDNKSIYELKGVVPIFGNDDTWKGYLLDGILFESEKSLLQEMRIIFRLECIQLELVEVAE